MTPVGPQVAQAVSGVPGVRSAVEIRTARLKLNGKVHDATAGPGQQLAGHYKLRLEEGTSAIRADDLLIDRATATAEGLKAGSTVQGEYQDGKKATLRIAGVYADVDSFLPTVPSMIMSPDSLRAHYPGARIDRLELTAGSGAEAAAIRAALAPWPNLELKDREEIKKDASGDIGAFLKMTLALLALSILIAALGIVNTLALSVVERTREIGLLRAVGMQRRQVRRMIRYEAVLISVFGVLLGLGVGVVFGVAVRHAMADEGVDVLAIPFAQLGAYVLAGAVIGVLAAVWPARRAARTDILRAITAP